jgi:DNA-binding MarR family transcriptional regulator
MEAKEDERDHLIEEILVLKEAEYRTFMGSRIAAWRHARLTLLQFKLLAVACLGKKVASLSVSKYLGISPSSLSRVTDQMVKRGLIERQEEPSDRRVVYLQGSEEGGRLLRVLSMEILPEQLRASLAGLPIEDLRLARDGMAVLRAAVERAHSVGEGS